MSDVATPDFEIIDFHTHFIDPGWDLPDPPAGDALRWKPIFARIRDEAALLAEIERGDLAGRVVNTPTALFAPEAGPETYVRINDQLAALQGRHPGRIHALASVDALINLENKGWGHILDRHYNPNVKANQFTITKQDLRNFLTSEKSVSTKVTRTLYSKEGTRYVREIDYGY